MEQIIHVNLRFQPGVEITKEVLSALTDNIIDLMYKQFPDHSGSIMSVNSEDGE